MSCPNDTDGDGDCGLCARSGGCHRGFDQARLNASARELLTIAKTVIKMRENPEDISFTEMVGIYEKARRIVSYVEGN